MRVERRRGYQIVVGGPVPRQAAAITLGKTIIVRKAYRGNQALLAHELVHVRQFARLGPIRFLGRYLGSYLKFRLSGYGHMAAYRRIPLEVEASWVSRLHPVADLEPCGDEDDVTSTPVGRRRRSGRVRIGSKQPTWPPQSSPSRLARPVVTID